MEPECCPDVKPDTERESLIKYSSDQVFVDWSNTTLDGISSADLKTTDAIN